MTVTQWNKLIDKTATLTHSSLSVYDFPGESIIMAFGKLGIWEILFDITDE